MKHLKYFENSEYYGKSISQDNITNVGYYIEFYVRTKMFFDWEYDELDANIEDFHNVDYYFYYDIDDENEDSIDKIYKSFESLGLKNIKIGEGLHSSAGGKPVQTEFIVTIDIDTIKKFSDDYDQYVKYNLI